MKFEKRLSLFLQSKIRTCTLSKRKKLLVNVNTKS